MTPNTSRRQSVLVLHTEPIVAAGLAAALKDESQFDVTVNERVAFDSPVLPPDVVVSDYATGIQLASQLKSGRPWGRRPVGLVVMTGRPREFEVQEALGHGVLGYLATGCGFDELIGAVHAAAGGRRYLCRAAAEHVANSMTCEALTSRELDVLRLVGKGLCNKVIASHLEIAVGTVKAHVRGILCKLNASSRTEAASIAEARGLLDEVRDAMHFQ